MFWESWKVHQLGTSNRKGPSYYIAAWEEERYSEKEQVSSSCLSSFFQEAIGAIVEVMASSKPSHLSQPYLCMASIHEFGD